MLLEWIEAQNFRNLTGKVHWAPGFNIIYGNNGQGKTNWLEAIHTLARSKSFRTQHLQEAIRFGEDLAVVRGRITQGVEVHRELQISLQGKTKTILVNGKREPLTSYLSQIHIVAFTAEELDVVRGMPEARRRFLDRGVASLRPTYVSTLMAYNRVLKQKNYILRDASEREISVSETENLVAPWNAQLASLGKEIHEGRSDYANRLNKVLARHIFGGEVVHLSYVSSL